MRKTKAVHAKKFDGVSEDIPNHFINIYKELYNCIKDGEDIKDISEQVEN